MPDILVYMLLHWSDNQWAALEDISYIHDHMSGPMACGAACVKMDYVFAVNGQDRERGRSL